VVLGIAAAMPEPEAPRSIAAAERVAVDDEPRAPDPPAPTVSDPSPVLESVASGQVSSPERLPEPERAALPRRSSDGADEEPDAALSAEVRLVREIRSAVASARLVADDRIARYRSEYPNGALLPEVEALAIELTCRTTPGAATTAIDAYARRFPGSSLVPRLRAVCSRDEQKITPQKPRGLQTQPL
jgi:hypothetical protein